MVDSVTVTPASATVDVGATVALSVDVVYSDGSTGSAAEWSSSNEAVATVSASGLVSGMAGGTATITAAVGGMRDHAVVSVRPELPSLAGRVLFSRLVDPDLSPHWAVFSMAANGSDVRLHSDSLSSWPMHPAASADGRLIAFVDYFGSGSFPGAFTQEELLVAGPSRYAEAISISNASSPAAFHPDGRLTAFLGSDVTLLLMDPDGGSPVELWADDLICLTRSLHKPRLSPQAWSPDGSEVFFNVNPYCDTGSLWAHHAIFRVVPATGELSQVIECPEDYEGDLKAPAIAVDGWMAFQGDCFGDNDIYVIGPDSAQAWSVAAHPGSDESPVWSPDGMRLAFASDRDGDYEIYVVNRDGSALTQLTRNSVGDMTPHWVGAAPSALPARMRFAPSPDPWRRVFRKRVRKD